MARRRRGGRPGRPAGDPPDDRELVARAVDLLRRRYDPERHTVAAAVRTRSGSVYLGLNLEGIHTPCAEPVALGAAVTAGEAEIDAIVAVGKRGTRYPLLVPCGTCRQLLADYAPNAYALVTGRRGHPRRLPVRSALPSPFRRFEP